MSEPLIGRVAKILSPYQIVINRGANHGVEQGMKFVIYEEGPLIYDPESQEALERLEISKGIVEVINIQEKISIAETETEERAITSDFFQRTVIRTSQKKLPVDDTISNSTPSPVRVGDYVRKIDS